MCENTGGQINPVFSGVDIKDNYHLDAKFKTKPQTQLVPSRSITSNNNFSNTLDISAPLARRALAGIGFRIKQESEVRAVKDLRQPQSIIEK